MGLSKIKPRTKSGPNQDLKLDLPKDNTTTRAKPKKHPGLDQDALLSSKQTVPLASYAHCLAAGITMLYVDLS